MVKQILPKAGEAILKLFSKLGGNMNNVLGSRSNITFLGKGKSPEGFIDMDINIDAIGALGKNKILEELESSIGYLTAGKLNDVQANKLLSNMQKVDDVFNPKQVANITDLGTGTRNLDAEGLGALRASGDYMTDEGVMASETILPMRDPRGLRFDEDSGVLKSMVGKENASGLRIDDLPPPGSRGGPDDIAAPVEQGFEGFERTIRELAKSDPDLAAQYKTVLTNKGATPSKRATAREFLVEALKKDEYDVGAASFGKTNLNNVVSAEDVKYITEGGGGIGGDPLLLVEKYFGPRIREMIPEGASSEEIAIFTKRVLENVVDAAGNKPGDPKFDRMTARLIEIKTPGGPEQPFADGGRAKFWGGGLGRAGKMGYQALRKYGIEAEDITSLFKSLATDKSLAGTEKTEYFKMLHQVLRNPDDYPEGVKEILIRLGKPVDFAEGGRAGYQEGGGIESRLEELGGDVTSAEKTLQDLTKRLETAGSNVPQPLMPQPRPSGPIGGGIGNFMGRPLLTAPLDPNFKTQELEAVQPGEAGPISSLVENYAPNLGTFPSSEFSSVEDAYADAQKRAQESRAAGMLGQVVLPGEMTFEAFSNMWNPSNPSGQLEQLPLSRGGPNRLPSDPFANSGQGAMDRPIDTSQQKSFPGGLYANGGLAKILEV